MRKEEGSQDLSPDSLVPLSAGLALPLCLAQRLTGSFQRQSLKQLGSVDFRPAMLAFTDPASSLWTS